MLSKRYRLKIADFFGSQAPKYKRVFRGESILVRVYSPAKSYSRFGVAIGKKVDPRASARNRVKRAIFFFCESAREKLPLADYVFLPSAKSAALTREQLLAELSQTFSQFPRF